MPRARACAVRLGTNNDEREEKRQLITDASFENGRQRRCRCNADDANDAMMMRQIKIDTPRKRKEGESSGTPASGCHNSPTLQEDLAPRSKNERGERMRKNKR